MYLFGEDGFAARVSAFWRNRKPKTLDLKPENPNLTWSRICYALNVIFCIKTSNRGWNFKRNLKTLNESLNKP